MPLYNPLGTRLPCFLREAYTTPFLTSRLSFHPPQLYLNSLRVQCDRILLFEFHPIGFGPWIIRRITRCSRRRLDRILLPSHSN